MTVQFGCSLRRAGPARLEPCLCSQLCAEWSLAYREPTLLGSREVADALAEEADPRCPHCRGTGVEFVPGVDPAEFEICQGFARTVLEVLGIRAEHLIGSLSIPEARRAVVRARNRDLARFLRPQEVLRGGPAFRGDGMIELSPIRAVIGELSEERILGYVDSFERLVVVAEERGSKAGEVAFICWA